MFLLCIFCFVSFLHSQEIIDKNIDENLTTPNSNNIKTTLLFGFHVPDEEFNEGYNGSISISNSINKYTFFTFDFNYDRFYGINNRKNKYKLDEISIGIGIFFNFLRLQKNTSYIGTEIGTYHIKNTENIKLNTKNAGNNIMLSWILGHSYSITEHINIESIIRLKANHSRNISINFGISYNIIK